MYKTTITIVADSPAEVGHFLIFNIEKIEEYTSTVETAEQLLKRGTKGIVWHTEMNIISEDTPQRSRQLMAALENSSLGQRLMEIHQSQQSEETRTICIWPDHCWCEWEDQEAYGAGKSDDFYTVEVSLDIDDEKLDQLIADGMYDQGR